MDDTELGNKKSKYLILNMLNNYNTQNSIENWLQSICAYLNSIIII